MTFTPSGEGMKGNTYGGSWRKDYPLGDLEKRLSFFKKKLSEHPEGIVIYCWYKSSKKQHAILLTDYDSKTDTFYCSDPSPSTASGRIRLEDSSLK